QRAATRASRERTARTDRARKGTGARRGKDAPANSSRLVPRVGSNPDLAGGPHLDLPVVTFASATKSTETHKKGIKKCALFFVVSCFSWPTQKLRLPACCPT